MMSGEALQKLRKAVELYDEWPPSDVPADAVVVIEAARELVQDYNAHVAYVKLIQQQTFTLGLKGHA